MEIDWSQVKKQTLWNYEDLIKKLLDVFSYSFVKTYYNHSMGEAESYGKKIYQGYLHDQDSKFMDEVIANLNKLAVIQVENYSALVQMVETREKCSDFLRRTGFGFDELIQILNYLFRWVLPFKSPVRELLDPQDSQHLEQLEVLKRINLRSNHDILDCLRGREARSQFSNETGIPEPFILELVHRADISRLAYVRGKTVRHLCGGGYDRLEKIASADLRTMEKDMDAYYRTLGKSLADFKSVIPLMWMIGGAKILPRVVEESED